jgi:hypothetical protein
MSSNEDKLDEDRHWFNARQYDRGDVQIYADIREQGAGKHKVNIIDLSRSGFRIHSLTYIKVDKTVFLTIPGYAPLEAHIAWHAGDLYGCEFKDQLHIAIYDHMLKTFPSLGQRR